MNKWAIIAGGILLGLIFLYGSLAALVNQGLGLRQAVGVLCVIIGGAGILFYAVREK